MMINSDNLVSITEADRDFSQAARMADQHGSAVILKNNVPSQQAEAVQDSSDEDVLTISRKLIAKNREAYEELAK